jgi:hypothetical protein
MLMMTTNNTPKKSYSKPVFKLVKVDTELSLAMYTGTPPGDPTGIGTAPGYVQKAIGILIR